MFFPIKLRLLAFNFEDRPRERKQILKKKLKNNRFNYYDAPHKP